MTGFAPPWIAHWTGSNRDVLFPRLSRSPGKEENKMRKILLVDDDRSFLAVMKHLLQKNRFSVTACSSPKCAVDLLRFNSFYAVISDYRMDECSGLELARIASDCQPPVPVFILTAYYDGFLSAHNRGFWGNSGETASYRVFTKPVDEKALIKAINELDECGDKQTDHEPIRRGQ